MPGTILKMMDRIRRFFSGLGPDAVNQQESQRSPPLDQSAFSILDLLAKQQLAQDALDQANSNLAGALRQWAQRPIQLILSIDGELVTAPEVKDVNDVSFVARVAYAVDAGGQHVADIGPFTWTVDPDAAATAGAAADDGSVTINVTPADAAGAQTDFTLTATDPNSISGSVACHPVAGGPTSLVLGVG